MFHINEPILKQQSITDRPQRRRRSRIHSVSQSERPAELRTTTAVAAAAFYSRKNYSKSGENSLKFQNQKKEQRRKDSISPEKKFYLSRLTGMECKTGETNLVISLTPPKLRVNLSHHLGFFSPHAFNYHFATHIIRPSKTRFVLSASNR